MPILGLKRTFVYNIETIDTSLLDGHQDNRYTPLTILLTWRVGALMAVPRATILNIPLNLGTLCTFHCPPESLTEPTDRKNVKRLKWDKSGSAPWLLASLGLGRRRISISSSHSGLYPGKEEDGGGVI